jgi:hypothetical protein
VTVFLIDGTPLGGIKVTLSNWKGVAYRIPRQRIDEFEKREHLGWSGVYFLFGTDEDSGEEIVYVGQAGTRKNGEGILARLKEHRANPNKDYWTEAVVFASSDNSLGPTEISWLENYFTNSAARANRYMVKNLADPTPGNVTEEKESELEEFAENAEIVMSTLGRKVFEPLRQSASSPLPQGETEPEGSLVFTIKRIGQADAKGMLTTEGFVVLAGSIIRKELTKSGKKIKSITSARRKNKKFIDERGTLLQDILFRTPSGASSFVLGSSTNGLLEWKSADGRSLRDVEVSTVDE